MSGFVKRNSVKTVNPAGGINPAQAPNVGQYGWTTGDSSNVNQIIEYVNMCKEYAERAKDSADYVELRFEELQRFMDFIETVYNELKPIIDEIQPIYQDIIFRHEDTITRHIDVIRLHNLVTADKVEINSIKEDAIKEITVIKQDTIAEANNIIEYGIKETEAVKELAVIEANRAKTEADRSAAEAVKSANSATASAGSATTSGTEAAKAAASAKEAADIAEELRKGQVYRGTWNIETNNAFPPKPDTNSVWDITLAESSTSFVFAGETWYWGDRLLFLKDEDKFSQIESGSTVISVNGKGGAVTLNAADVGALDKSGDTMTGDLKIGATLTIDNKFVKGTNDSVVLRDHGNGNVTLSAGLSSTGVAGDLYLGYNATAANTAGYNTRNIQVRSPMQWAAGTTIVNESGVNSEFLQGPIRTEKTAGNVYHTIVGGTDSVNRGRTIIAAGESGKVIADNTNAESEGVHISGDQVDGVYVHTGIQQGWGTAPHYRYQFKEGDLYSQAMSGSTINKFYHTGNKPQPSELGAVRKSGDNEVGSLTLASGKVLDATLTHQRGYLSVYPYGSTYGLGGASGNRCRIYYKEHNNGNPSDLSRGLVIASTDADGISHSMDIWLGSNKVYHQGFKPTPADIKAVPLDGSTAMTGNLRAPSVNFTNDEAVIYDKDGLPVVQTTKQFGGNLFGSDQKQTYLVFKDNLVARKGATDYKVYHEGFKPDISDLLGQGSSTNKTVTLTVPPGVESGKYYPVLFNGTAGYPDVQITTASGSSVSSMNNCSFKGQVLSGGWSDKGRYVSGNFTIYDASERAIHSVVGGSEAENHYVIYVEARSFPITVTTDSRVTVTSTGKDTSYGTSLYKAAISGMTASGDYGTKVTLLRDFNKGGGFYGDAFRATYIDVAGGINATSRVNLLDYNDNGAFITRRPGKTSYSMMGQDSNGNTMLGLGVDSSGYSSYLKVSGSTLGYSANGSTESRVYHEGFKPSLGELGGIASTGGTMTGRLNWQSDRQYVNATQSNMYVAALDGLVYIEGKNNPIARVNGVNYTFYHQGFKPTADDVGAIPTTGGRMTGKLQIYGASSQLEIIENDQAADKVWRFEAQNNNLDFTESGVATRLRLHAGGGSTFSGNMAVGGHITLNQGNILKFPSANYATGAQMYTRDGGQYGSNFVLNTGGNMVLGAGECGTALADIIGSASTEHAYIAADGDTHIISGANTIGDRKITRYAANGDVYVNEGAAVARTYYGSDTTYIAKATDNLYLANKTASGRIYLESNTNPIARVGTNDYTIYHSGNLPSFGDLSLGKAIGASQIISSSASDLNDFKTAGVYHQPANAGATAGLNYPEPLAGSLIVYTAAGIIQEYRVYNSSKLYRRGQYSTGNWSAWSSDFNSIYPPTATQVGALPTAGGKITGTLEVGTSGQGIVYSGESSNAARGIVWKSKTNTDLVMMGAQWDGQASVGKNFYVGTGSPWADTSGSWFTAAPNGVLRANSGNRIYHQGFKPTAAEVGALPISGGTLTNQVIASHRKSSIVVANQASITYYDGNNGWFQNYAEGTELKWGTGNDSSQTVRMALTPAGQLRISGDFVSGAGVATTGNMTTNGGGSFLSSGIFRTTRDTNPMVEWHKPGVKAYVQYIDSSNNLRIAQSNGAGSDAGLVATMNPTVLHAAGKFQTAASTNRAWTAVGVAGLYVDNSTISAGNGTYQVTASMYTYLPGQYYNENSYGYFHGANWASGYQTLTCYNASSTERLTWMLKNNGGFENSSGRWRVQSDGNVVASAWGGSSITDWVSRNFAPASDANLKTLLGESKVSALGQVAKMKFHQYVWNDVGFAKESVKVNRLGVVAQEMEEIDANYVRDIETFTEEGEKESIKTLDTANLLAVALKAIQELEAKVASLEEKLNDLV